MIAVLVWESLNHWPVAAGLVALLTLMLLWIYPGQLHRAGWRGLAPPLLRWGALVAIVLALLKPVVLWPKSAEQLGAVAVLLDCSRSMGVTDAGRTPAERVALTAALGRLPAEVRSHIATRISGDLDRLANRLQDVLTAKADLNYARLSGRGVTEKQTRLREQIAAYQAARQELIGAEASVTPDAELRQRLRPLAIIPAEQGQDAWLSLRDRIEQAQLAARAFQSDADERLYRGNPQVRDACDQVARLSRLELAQQALLGRHGLMRELSSDVPLIGYAIDQGLKPIELRRNGDLLAELPVLAEGNDSDIAGAVAAVPAMAHQPLRAIVLLSDGRQVGGRGEVISTLHPGGVPVFCIGMAPRQPPDVSIVAATPFSHSAFAGETMEGEARVRAQGGIKMPAELRVSSAGLQVAEPLVMLPGQSRPGGAQEAVARFSVPAQSPDGDAAQRIDLTVPSSPDESTAQNNSVQRWVKICSDKVNVALCTTAPSWDFQYLHHALSRTPWVVLDWQVLDPRHPKFGLSPQQIRLCDVLVLDDVPADALTAQQWSAVQQWLQHDGGSIILIPGQSSSLDGYFANPTAAKLLPFSAVAKPAWKTWPGEAPAFRFILTPLARQELGLGVGIEPESRRVSELSGFYRYLAISPRSLTGSARPLLVEALGGAPVLTEHRLGAGRVLFLASNEIWRSRQKGTEQDVRRFWRQLVRYAAGEPYAATSGPLALDADTVATQPGEPVHVRARVRSGTSLSPSARSCPLEVLRQGKMISTRRLDAVGGGHFATVLRDLPPGEYQLQLRGAVSGRDIVARVPLHIAVSHEAEVRDISGDPAMLLRIARASGGEYLPIERIDRLAGRLSGLRDSQSQYVRRPLWNSPLLFGFVLACLAGEWAVRKRLGLA